MPDSDTMVQGQEREEELLRDARQHLAEAEARLEAERAQPRLCTAAVFRPGSGTPYS